MVQAMLFTPTGMLNTPVEALALRALLSCGFYDVCDAAVWDQCANVFCDVVGMSSDGLEGLEMPLDATKDSSDTWRLICRLFTACCNGMQGE